MSTGNTELYQEYTHMKFSDLIIHTLACPENWAKVIGQSLCKIASVPMSHSHWLYPECSQIYHDNIPLSQRESRGKKGNCRSSYAYPNNNGSIFPQKKWCSALGEDLETHRLGFKGWLSHPPVTRHWATYWNSGP